jgi:FKBP-type peptidyl-prolyl cis-trans isomerase SlyD
MTEMISKDKYVSLTYSISDEQGETLERIDLPVKYIQGHKSQVIEKIEQTLEGHKTGDEVDVTLSPEEGFGEYQEELSFTDDVKNVPTQFHQIGAEVEFKNDRGEVKIFHVTKIENGKLTVDGNHPFAGKTIIYNIKVNEVRDATQEEIANGVTNTPKLH